MINWTARRKLLSSGDRGTVELIPEPTVRLVEKSFAKNTLRNRRHALQKFNEWLNGRQVTDGLLAEYITHLFNDSKAPEQSALSCPQ